MVTYIVYHDESGWKFNVYRDGYEIYHQFCRMDTDVPSQIETESEARELAEAYIANIPKTPEQLRIEQLEDTVKKLIEQLGGV